VEVAKKLSLHAERSFAKKIVNARLSLLLEIATSSSSKENISLRDSTKLENSLKDHFLFPMTGLTQRTDSRNNQ
jgi:hypothetical protein